MPHNPAHRSPTRQDTPPASPDDPPPLAPRSRPGALTLLLPALLIVGGLALIFAGQTRPSTSETAASASLSGYEWAEAPMADFPTAPAGAPAAESAKATAQPAPAVEAQGHETYCLWPGDTLSHIALNAQVPQAAILAANPNWTGHAGAAIRLPAGSVPPAQWTSPLPPVTRFEDLPFGISGYYLGRNNRQKQVALSFDLGYAEGNKELKEMLAARGIRATFFVLGGALVRHPYIIGQILDNGHELGNHSYTHDNMLRMAESTIRWELGLTEQLTQEAYPGATTKPIFRAPFGAINDTVVRVSNSEGYHVVGWTVDSRDWTDDITADAIYQRVVEHICPGAIIAFHDVNPANAAARPRLLDYLEANGYRFVTASEIMSP